MTRTAEFSVIRSTPKLKSTGPMGSVVVSMAVVGVVMDSVVTSVSLSDETVGFKIGLKKNLN